MRGNGRETLQIRRAEGKAHVNTVGNVVPPRVTGKRCECKNRCFHYFSEELRKPVLKKVNAIGDKQEPDLFGRSNSFKRSSSLKA